VYTGLEEMVFGRVGEAVWRRRVGWGLLSLPSHARVAGAKTRPSLAISLTALEVFFLQLHHKSALGCCDSTAHTSTVLRETPRQCDSW
jgi:hypothetical protein